MTKCAILFGLIIIFIFACSQKFKTVKANESVFQGFFVKAENENTFRLSRAGDQIAFVKQTSDPEGKLFDQHRISYKNYLINLLAGDDQFYGTVKNSEKCHLLEALAAAKVSENPQSKTLTFNLLATENFLYGSCDAITSFYKSKLILIECKNAKKLIEIKNFFKNVDALNVDPQAFCAKF